MKGLALVWAGLMCFLAQQVHAQISPGSEHILASKFKSYQIITDEGTHPATPAAKQSSSQALHFSLDGGATSVVINLEPNDIRDASYRAVATTARGEVVQPRSPVKWFKGYVNCDTGAPARFSIERDGPSGFFFQGDRQRFVEPLARHCPAPAGLLLVYDAADVISQGVRCDATEVEQYRATPQGRQATATLPPLKPDASIKLALDADYAYYSLYQAETHDHILGVINQIDGLYEKDFGINFKVTYLHIYETNDDPYTATDALALLQQFRDYWNAHHADVDRHVAFLFNGVDLPSSTLGRAYQAQACIGTSSSYGFFSRDDPFYEVDVVAHEIAHTLNAEHETIEACSADPSIMCPGISEIVQFKFSQTARTAITTYLQTHECFNSPLLVRIHPIPTSTDLVIETSGTSFSVTLYDPLGKPIGTWTSAEAIASIPTTHLSAGLYILHITAGDQTTTHRVEIIRP